MTRASVGPLSECARVCGRGSSRVSAIVAHLSDNVAQSCSSSFHGMERKWRALIIVCVAIFMLLLDITVVNVALPSIQKDLHTSFTDLQWVVDAYALMLATCMLNAGSLGDLLGRKRIFISGVVTFTLASAL